MPASKFSQIKKYCKKCPAKGSCLKSLFLGPVLGLCSLAGVDSGKAPSRKEILRKMHKRVTESGGSVFLRHKTPVKVYDVAGALQVDVLRIWRIPGAPEKTQCFQIADGYTTAELDDRDLGRILREITITS